jgi:hypothetical protein
MAKKIQEDLEPTLRTCALCGYESDEEGSFCPVCGEEYK